MTNTNNNLETEYNTINSQKAWPKVFRTLAAESLKNESSCVEAKKPQNKNLNRYRDVNPYDQSRIILSRGTCDYINANLVEVKKANRKYILTQGPLPETVGHFWAMIWEHNSKAIIMLNKLIEKKAIKCHCYWPERKDGDEDNNNKLDLDDVNLIVELLHYQDFTYFCTRTFRLTDKESNISREIIQFHYTTWPDFGVPTSPTQFLDFLNQVRDSDALNSELFGPPVVHCSAGIGRSGTFCLVDSCLILISKYGCSSVDIKSVMMEMRKYRMGLIQTADQLKFSYLAIIEGAKRINHIYTTNGNEDNLNSNIREENGNNNQSSSSPALSDDDDEGPPPPVPTRSLSLQQTRSYDQRPLPNIPNSSSINDFVHSSDNHNEHDNNTNNDESNNLNGFIAAPKRPLPSVPDKDSSADESISDVDEPLIGDKDGLKKRLRMERQEKLSNKIIEIKRKQKEAEQWEQTKRFKPNDGEHSENKTEHEDNEKIDH